jgi:hypothetical protein
MSKGIQVLSLTLIVALGGCATGAYGKAQPFHTDREYCGFHNDVHFYDYASVVAAKMTACMAVRGWVPVKGPLVPLVPAPYDWRWVKVAEAGK